MKAHSGDVAVFVRIRPTANFAQDLIECLPDGKLQDSRKTRQGSWSFRLEGVLQDVSQEEVYSRVCQRVVQGALDGYNGRSLYLYKTDSV
uniref:Kinesin motor domain-containing protein n=1 Tax=Lates calcarifer TaxID=8187 RepID=A0A4W6DUM4_LATCA